MLVGTDKLSLPDLFSSSFSEKAWQSSPLGTSLHSTKTGGDDEEYS
jgi:hypothetical protein